MFSLNECFAPARKTRVFAFAAILAAFATLVALPTLAQAQVVQTPTVVNDSLHPGTYDYVGGMYDGTALAALSIEKSAATVDTLKYPGITSKTVVFASYADKSPIASGLANNTPYVVTATDVAYVHWQRGDTATVNFLFIGN